MQLRIHPQATLAPFDWYRAMRDNEPVAYDEVRQMWHVFRYRDVAEVLSDHRVFSSDRGWLVQQKQQVPVQRFISLIGIDPPRHRQLRALTAQEFTPRTIGRLEPAIRELAGSLLDRALERDDLDVIRDLAYPLPMLVVGQLLGLPADDRERLKGWADKVVAGNFETIGQNAQERHAVTLEMAGYFREIITQRRHRPGPDLISRLLEQRSPDAAFEEDELIAFCILLLIAGHETTTCLIGNLVLALDEHAATWAALQQQPALAPAVIEEVLRLYAPLKAISRVTMDEVTLGGCTIAAKSPVAAWVGSANRDERQFYEPDQLDTARTNSGHLSFGHGIHSCLGVALGRLEARIVLETLLERIAAFACPPAETLEPLNSLMLYGVKRLPISVQPR